MKESEMRKLSVGVLGATGMVGQQYIALLKDHPWFQVTYVAASPRNAGKRYADAVSARWQLAKTYGPSVGDLILGDANDVDAARREAAQGRCDFVFSALDMGKDEIRSLEEAYAAANIPVVSNASAHRGTPDVPMLIPEINHAHADIIPLQRENRGWDRGFITVKPNCSIQSYMTPIYALINAGYEVRRLFVSTMQAVSGAGYPGVPSLDMVDNIVPFIGGEEEKSELEPLKILGKIDGAYIRDAEAPLVTAHCNRVPVTDGHTACVSLEFGEKKPSLEEVRELWEAFRSLPQELALPSAPERPIIYREEADRPQPRKDRDADKSMAVSVGRLRPCNIFDLRFVGLSHNTIRGAAGGGVLNAELMKAKGYL